MEELSSIFSYECFIIAFAASAILWLVNRYKKDLRSKKWVMKLMPIYPFILAAIFSIFIHPAAFVTVPQYLIWSTIPGLVSNVGFKIIKTVLFEKTGVDIEKK